jgi:CubicO group peptidase (beta-lactamase class C family)
MRSLALAMALAGSLVGALVTAGTASSASTRAKIDTAIRQTIRQDSLGAVIVQVTVGGKPLMTKAYGESMTGVPATTDMHFRNGAVAISYMSTLLLRLVDQGKVKLDDKVSRWLPDLRDGDRVTLGMLAGMTAGYHDFEADPRFVAALYRDPFARVTTNDQLSYALSIPQLFTPGSNWSYAHSDYVILGLALEKLTGKPLEVLLRNQVLRPLRLRNTNASQTAAIPSPVLHAFSSERQGPLGIPFSTPFLEESTYWNPSWTLARGAVQTTDIADMTRTAIGIGSGKLLSKRSYARMMDPRIGFGQPFEGCEACHKLDRYYGYGLGVVRNGSWSLQNPLFAGYAAVEAYLPSKKISIAVATTFTQASYDVAGNPAPAHTALYSQIGAILAPNDAPPVPPS